jgi:hypothetical protein
VAGRPACKPDPPEDRGRRARVADLAWRFALWAADADASNEPEQAHAYRRASDEVKRVGELCWLGFDVERDRRPGSMTDLDDLLRFEGVSRSVLEARIRLLVSEVRAVQDGAQKLINELRAYRASRAMPGLGWDCQACGVFNGDGRERLTSCRCCGALRST